MMKTKLLIFTGTAVLGLVLSLGILFYLQGISSGEQQDICLENEGMWDYEHDTCDRIDLVSCTLMNGVYQECKPRELKCPLKNPNCTATASCVSTCLFEQTTRTKTMTPEETKTVDVFLSPPHAGIKNCSDFLGKPDGKCFVNSYENCQPAIIQQSIRSMEGDPIFFYAQVLHDSCMISFVIDDRYDKYGPDKAVTERICHDAKLLDGNLNFQCGDDVDRYGFPLR